MEALTTEVISRTLEQVGSMVLYILVGTLVLEVVVYLVLGKVFKSRYTLPYMLVAAAAVGLALLVVYPIGYEVRLAFTNMSLRHFREYTLSLAQGLENFKLIFTEPVLKAAGFFPLLVRTILWTAINLIFHVSGGLGLALLLNRAMRGRGLYRTLLVFPWAIPQVIAVLAWRGEFHFEFGFINVMLRGIGLQPIQWMTSPFWNFAAASITNIWLGIPFMMIIMLGGLQSIPAEFYDAAEIDGASGWQQFRTITLPMLRPVLTPAVILGTIWTFNNFNVPYLINMNELETSDILVTALFRAAFEYNRYGFSAAFALVTLAILFIFALTYIRVTRGLKGVYE
ncbi:arabinogalactan oligomer / maltooligosaccharide transport system permease protein [Candidatus Hakubella thermalkaliphila]|uniref:Arabinogalactan oligomer / maltooligosaccharide transport system permease protein n=2 Tax=Candidatus Hakubella thermalkaliphila TaxID=2754717 RepID=A0A6V8P261_9ACTN|nr:arabinogalactan oligomer / maltooligosaccharide transport system permease protein [Candidatus Hakubella thermalkaliphila]